MNTTWPAPEAVGRLAAMACLMEITAPKPGNVHRGADFEDADFFDFAASALAIQPALALAAAGEPIGTCVLGAISATKETVGTNTNLGTVLLLVPLAGASRKPPLSDEIGDVLKQLTPADARHVYEAIRLAAPGGLGHAQEADVWSDPPCELLRAMRLAADRDRVARQYTDDFADVFGRVVPWLAEGVARHWPLSEVIVYVHVRVMRAFPDSLIARKCGPRVAAEAAARAAAVLESGEPGEESYRQSLGDLDFWLRSDHHRRNPGTTADLIAAGLFAALVEGIIQPPFRFFR